MKLLVLANERPIYRCGPSIGLTCIKLQVKTKDVDCFRFASDCLSCPIGELGQVEHVGAPSGKCEGRDDKRNDAGSYSSNRKISSLYVSRRSGDRIRRCAHWQMK